MSSRRNILHAMTVVVGSSVVVSALGFAKNVLAAYYFGTSGIMDAYLVALLLPDLVEKLSLTGLINFVPLFAEERARSEESAWTAASKMMSYWLLLLAVVIALALALTPQMTTLLAPGFKGAQRGETLAMSRTLFLMTAAVATSRVIGLGLYAQRQFMPLAIAEGMFQVTSTLYLVVFRSWGIEALVWGMVFGGFSQLLVITIGSFGQRRQIRLSLDLKNRVVRKMIGLTVPTYVGNFNSRITTIFNRAFASLLPAGAVSSLQYAYTLTEAPVSLLASPVSRAIFPFLAAQFAEDAKKARSNIGRAIFTMTVVFLPMALGTVLVAKPLVRFLFQRGSFDARSADLTVSALQMYAPQILLMALNGLLVAAFNANKNTATPMLVGLARVATNCLLCYPLVPHLGHAGVALANTLAEVVKLGLLLYLMRHIFAGGELKATLRSVARLTPAAAAMAVVVAGVVAYDVRARLPWGPSGLLPLLGMVLMGGATYAFTLYFVCPGEFAFYVNVLREELGRVFSGRVKTGKAVS